MGLTSLHSHTKIKTPSLNCQSHLSGATSIANSPKRLTENVFKVSRSLGNKFSTVCSLIFLVPDFYVFLEK